MDLSWVWILGKNPPKANMTGWKSNHEWAAVSPFKNHRVKKTNLGTNSPLVFLVFSACSWARSYSLSWIYTYLKKNELVLTGPKLIYKYIHIHIHIVSICADIQGGPPTSHKWNEITLLNGIYKQVIGVVTIPIGKPHLGSRGRVWQGVFGNGF